jgi:hypothetical protein
VSGGLISTEFVWVQDTQPSSSLTWYRPAHLVFFDVVRNLLVGVGVFASHDYLPPYLQTVSMQAWLLHRLTMKNIDVPVEPSASSRRPTICLKNDPF